MNLLCPTAKPTSLRKLSSLISQAERGPNFAGASSSKLGYLVYILKFLEVPSFELGLQLHYCCQS